MPSKSTKSKRARKPSNIEHALVFAGGTARVESVESTWGAMPEGSEDMPGVILSCCHADTGAFESTLPLDADELDELIGSLIEARCVLTARHNLRPGHWG